MTTYEVFSTCLLSIGSFVIGFKVTSYALKQAFR